MVISQPKMAMLPMAARLAGSINTPEPIILPATISVAGTKPILLFSFAIIFSCEKNVRAAKAVRTRKQN